MTSPQAYDDIQTLYKALPAFSPYIPAELLPYLACMLLGSTFTLAFYFSTTARLPKATIPARELSVASTASLLAGFGVVALFCSVGVYV